MSLLTKFIALNDADLSGLQARITALREEAEKELVLTGQKDRPLVDPDLQVASQETGLSVESLLDALETAQRVT